QALRHARVPDPGHLAHRDGSGEQLLLELEAEDDVEAVGDLVGVTANQAGPDGVDSADKGGFVDSAEPLREEGLQLRIEPAPEGGAAADEVLPRAALRLVDRARRAALLRVATPRGTVPAAAPPPPSPPGTARRLRSARPSTGRRP